MDSHFEENHRHKTTLDNLMEGFQLISFDWRYLYVNDAVVEQSKYAREQLLGYTMMEKYPGIEKTKLFTVLRKCMKERVSAYFENEFQFPDESTGWFELRIHPVPEGLFILSIDITDRKKADSHRKKYMEDLEEMIFITCHKVRQPVVNILGVAYLLDMPKTTQDDLRTMLGYIKQSAITLDDFTKELTQFVHNLKEKAHAHSEKSDGSDQDSSQTGV
jgi:PAS domain S-box-containing protein